MPAIARILSSVRFLQIPCRSSTVPSCSNYVLNRKYSKGRREPSEEENATSELLSAIDGVKSHLGGDTTIKDELIIKLQRMKGAPPSHKPSTKAIDSKSEDIMDSLTGMLADKGMTVEGPAHQFNQRRSPEGTDFEEEGEGVREKGGISKNDMNTIMARILGTVPPKGLGIFQASDFDTTENSVDNGHPKLKLWKELKDKRVERWAAAQQPRNSFEQMIRWTKEGKMWPYPIDNEWRITEVEDCGFDEHVFLEAYLDELNFPKDGPIRHFMELVAAGLSKNPYMTAVTKRGHLQWFLEYFDQKKELIKRLELADQDQKSVAPAS